MIVDPMGIEYQLLLAHDALSAVLDDPALENVLTEAHDLQDPTKMRPITEEIVRVSRTVEWAIRVVRRQIPPVEKLALDHWATDLVVAIVD